MAAVARVILSSLLALASACDAGAPAEDPRPATPSPGGKADSIDGAPATSVRPPLVQIVNNSRGPFDPLPTPQPLPQLQPLTQSELDDALDALADAIDFADYPFSGCHDRAHATALHLGAIVGSSRVAKVWVFGPTLLTVAVPGAIESPVEAARWGAPTTTWDYHVAAVVEGPEGLRVIDPVLAAIDEPLTLDAWFGHMTIAPGSVYTLAPAQLYSFNTTDSAAYAGARMPFNGSMFTYSGFARSDRWLEKNLARDEVAVALADGGGECPALGQYLLDPQALYDALQSMASQGSPHGCEAYVQHYLDAREAWHADILAVGG